MPSVSDPDFAVARVYSAAMLQLAESQGEVDVLLEELRDFAARIDENAELRAFLSSPTVDMDVRRRTLETMLRGRYSDLLVDSLQVLNRKGRLGLIPSVAEAYALARDEFHGRVQVQVRTAAFLSVELRERIKDVVGRYTGKEADLVETVDESLIGGLVVQIGDQKFDTSVATRLKRLGGALRDRASQEIHSGRTHVEGLAV